MLCAMRKTRRWYSSCISSIRAFRFWKYSGCSSVDKRGASSWPPHSWPQGCRADPTRERCGCRGHKCHHAFTRAHCEWPSAHHHEQSSLSRGSSTPASSPSPCEPSCFPPCMGGLATNPRLTGPDPPVVGGCPNCLVPHVAVIHQVLHQGVQVTYGQREQVGIRSVVFSCQPFPALVLVTMFSGKPCSLVAPARGSGSMHPMRTGVLGGWSLPVLKGSVSPSPMSLTPRSPTSPYLRHGDTFPLAGSMWLPQTSRTSPPLTCQLALIQVFHGVGLAEARHADVHSRSIGHFPRGSVVHHPAGTGQKVAEEPCPHGGHGARVEITGWQLGPGQLFPSLVWMGRWTGAKPASTPIGRQLGAGGSVAAPSPCGPRQGGSISSGC